MASSSSSSAGNGAGASGHAPTSAPTNDPSGSAPSTSSSPTAPLVMQLILPRSLPNQPGWSTGPLIAQGAHAACAILALTAEHALTREYLSPEGLSGGMHKVVLQWPGKEKKKKTAAGVGGGMGAGQAGDQGKEEEEEGLEELSARLSAARAEWEQRREERTRRGNQDEGKEEEEFPVHTMWIEQPDKIATCIAIAPNRKPPALKKILNKCALFRG